MAVSLFLTNLSGCAYMGSDAGRYDVVIELDVTDEPLTDEEIEIYHDIPSDVRSWSRLVIVKLDARRFGFDMEDLAFSHDDSRLRYFQEDFELHLVSGSVVLNKLRFQNIYSDLPTTLYVKQSTKIVIGSI